MVESVVSSQFQITLPLKIRQALGIEKNDRVRYEMAKDSVVVRLVPSHDELVERWTSEIDPEIEPLKNADELYQTRKARR
jgi:bifunctional DNA-binding transcriptional regulator/antitoxin component of YhaV-PrlF toxin-antitoxin module